MKDTEEIGREIQRLKKTLSEEKENIQAIEELIGGRIKVDLWGLGEKDLEKMTWESFSFLERNKDCLAPTPITSHREYVGGIIVAAKKALRALTRWYAELILRRQKEFDGELIQILLAMLLRLEKMNGRIGALEALTHPASPNKEERV
ncbi:MAG TPA: hypothetical protein DIW61_04390 [Candidatus Aminicenantes bacterium]|nr:hypothetical protein [Candidatus Aminicenantes bacterium]